MLKLVLLNGDSAGHFISALEACSLEDVVRISLGIIQLWLKCIQIQVQHTSTYGISSNYAIFRSDKQRLSPQESISANGNKNLHNREKTRLFQKVSNVDIVLYNIIMFATDAARRSPTIRRGMLEAGTLSLVVVALTNVDFVPSNLIDAAVKGKQKAGHTGNIGSQYSAPSPRAVPFNVINDEAATLSSLIHHAPFCESWSKKQFNIRRHLCSSLMEVLLGDLGKKDDRHAWTRALFRKIVT
jgi:hypothetical protein